MMTPEKGSKVADILNALDPAHARPCCTCPSDFMSDCLLDLSCGWEKPVRCECREAPACVRQP